MDDRQASAIALAKLYETKAEELKNIRQDLNTLLKEIGAGTMFQDPITKCVYQVAVPKGRYVEYFDIDYNRTKLPDEDKGSLSAKAAEAAGFKLK